MSHEIHALNIKREPIATISYGANDAFKNAIYEVLEATTYNNGISGNGKTCSFSKEEVITALNKIKSQGTDIFEFTFQEDDVIKTEYKRLKAFIEKCLKTANRQGMVEISFR